MVRLKTLCGLCSSEAPIIGNRGSLLDVSVVRTSALFVLPGLKSRLRAGHLLYRCLPPLYIPTATPSFFLSRPPTLCVVVHARPS